MKTDNKKACTIRVVSDGTITPKIENELKVLANMTHDDVDTTDIPEISDWSNAVVGRFFRPVKETVTVRLDADVLHWLKQGGKGYQSRLNAILRKEMTSKATRRKAA